jgi:membrane protease YdiL (CAAX protease family)
MQDKASTVFKLPFRLKALLIAGCLICATLFVWTVFSILFGAYKLWFTCLASTIPLSLAVLCMHIALGAYRSEIIVFPDRIVLNGVNGKRVLYFDQFRGMRLLHSPAALRVTLEPKDQREIDVQFAAITSDTKGFEAILSKYLKDLDLTE